MILDNGTSKSKFEKRLQLLQTSLTSSKIRVTEYNDFLKQHRTHYLRHQMILNRQKLR